MPRTILTFLFALITLSSSADSRVIDSLKNAVRYAQHDTNRIDLLIELSQKIPLKDSMNKLAYAYKALEIAKLINNENRLMYCYLNFGRLCFTLNNFTLAVKYFNEYQHAATLQTDTFHEIDALGNLLIAYGNISQYTLALDCGLKALQLRPNQGTEDNILSNMGVIYLKVSDYTKAMDCYTQALNIREQMILSEKVPSKIDTQTLAGLVLSIGDIYFKMREFEKALENYNKTIAINKNSSISLSILALTGKGKIFEARGNFIEAIDLFKQALTYIHSRSHNENVTNIFTALANLYLKNGEIKVAQNYVDSAYTLAMQNGSELKQPDIYVTLAKINIRLKKYGEAATNLNNAIHIAVEIHTLETEGEAWNLLCSTYEAMKKPTEALAAYRQYISIRDSVYNTDKAKELTRMDIESAYNSKSLADSVKSVQSKAENELKMQKQRVLTYSGFTGLALVILLAFFIFRNYSQQKKANVVIQAEKENAELQRQRAERSEAFKQQFLANMSHEIRTPMNAVMGMTSLALDTGVPEKQKMYLAGIKKSSDNLLHIINDILDLSKIEAGKMELEEIDFSLAATLEQVKQVLSYRAEEKGLQLVIFIDPAVPDVAIGDPVRLGQVLLNLAGNGIKFTEQGSVSIELKQVNEGVRFSVTDTGIGIPKDKLELVFEKFSQANSSDTRKYGGTGLGLSISQQLVELMGGHIAIESVEGSGTTFSFILNLLMGSEERLKQRLSAEEDVDGSALDGLSILVVDDNEYNRIVARDTLEAKAKVKIDAVGSAKEGLALLQQKHFDMVLMDVQMPVMNGFDATRHIREQMEGPVKDIPVIALTASVLRTDLDKCKAAGMNAYVSKPFKASQLIGAIAEVLGLNTRAGMPVQSREPKLPSATSVTDLTYLATYCEGDKERMAGYINMYLKAAGGFEEKVKAAINTGEAEDAAALAHAFKPKWKMMGMALCVDLGQKVEFMSKEAGNEEHIKNALLRLTEYNWQSVMELESFV